EQSRIACTIDTSVAHVNAAKNHLANALVILKRFRQSVLAAACSGGLTEDWRQDHEQGQLSRSDLLVASNGTSVEPLEDVELPDSWAWARLDQICLVQRGRFSVRPRNDPRYYGGRYPFVQIGDLPPQGGNIKAYAQTLNDQGL